MIGKAILSDDPIVEQDVTQAANWRPNPYLPDTHSELALALRTRGRTIGALTVQSTQIGNFSQENITVLQTVADQMATAIENASLFAETEERMGEWRLLFNITQAAASSIDSQERIENVVEALYENLGGAHVTLMIANDAAQQLQVIAAKGGHENPTHLSYSEGLPGQVVQLGQPMMINDLRELPDFKTGHEGSLSQLVVPLNLGGRTIGLIDVQSREVDAFTERELRLLQSLSVSLAATIQTGRLIRCRFEQCCEAERIFQRYLCNIRSLPVDLRLTRRSARWQSR
jgi:GAF domain-containing protein